VSRYRLSVVCQSTDIDVLGRLHDVLIFLGKVAGPAGLEPATSWFVARRSIQLSYGPEGSELLILAQPQSTFASSRRPAPKASRFTEILSPAVFANAASIVGRPGADHRPSHTDRRS
jgi:hypothetical protein